MALLGAMAGLGSAKALHSLAPRLHQPWTLLASFSSYSSVCTDCHTGSYGDVASCSSNSGVGSGGVSSDSGSQGSVETFSSSQSGNWHRTKIDAGAGAAQVARFGVNWHSGTLAAALQQRGMHTTCAPASAMPARAVPAAAASHAGRVSPAQRAASAADEVRWVFLGPPGVGKGTYASRIAAAFGVAHIAAGDVIRQEIRGGSALGRKMSEIVRQGMLLPDDLIYEVFQTKLDKMENSNGPGFILDGFPRTASQADTLLRHADITLALNLSIRESIIIQKCIGRRVCNKCGKNYNLANICLPAEGLYPEISMPPLSPPRRCLNFMEQRPDDVEEVIRNRLKVYWQEARPVEDIFRRRGLLLEFEITGGIPETMGILMDTLRNYHRFDRMELQAHVA